MEISLYKIKEIGTTTNLKRYFVTVLGHTCAHAGSGALGQPQTTLYPRCARGITHTTMPGERLRYFFLYWRNILNNLLVM